MRSTSRPIHTHVAIVGSGFAGLGAAIRLKQQGRDDFVILERADEVGGTWRDNRYPGCACDVQSHLYSFSFAPNPDWSHSYSSQPEIRAYLQRCAHDSGVLPHLRTGHDVRAARWDDGAGRWCIETSHGEFTATVLILATGPLSDPVIPALPGLDRFAGRVFHSARWDEGLDLAGQRVAVIGTGASAVQFVPEIQPRVARLHVFQRTAPWVLPRLGRRITVLERRAFRRVPALQRLARLAIYLARESMVVAFRRPRVMRGAEWLARWHLARAVDDPALRARLTPTYTMGCKRVLLSNDYLPALARPNVEVVTSGIAEVRARSIVAGDGVERPVDVVIFGTGFQPTAPPLGERLVGRAGVTLAGAWAGSPKAHLGTTVAGFPNLFVLLGPNTGLGHSSVVYMIEAQLEHVLRALREMERAGIRAVEPTAAAQAAWVAEVDQRMRGTVWTAGGCSSWYLDETGRNSTLWPDFSWRFRRRVARAGLAAYATRAAQPSPAQPSPAAAGT